MEEHIDLLERCAKEHLILVLQAEKSQNSVIPYEAVFKANNDTTRLHKARAPEIEMLLNVLFLMYHTCAPAEAIWQSRYSRYLSLISYSRIDSMPQVESETFQANDRNSKHVFANNVSQTFPEKAMFTAAA